MLFWFGSSRFVRRSFYVYGESGFGNDGSDESGYEALSADEIGDGESSFIHIPCVVENNCWCIFPTIMGDGTTGMGQIYDAKKVRE